MSPFIPMESIPPSKRMAPSGGDVYNRQEENLSLSSQYILLNLVFLNLADFPLQRQIP